MKATKKQKTPVRVQPVVLAHDEEIYCPQCGKPLKAKKSCCGLMACYCQWAGRKPTANQVVEAAERWERQNAEVSEAADKRC